MSTALHAHPRARSFLWSEQRPRGSCLFICCAQASQLTDLVFNLIAHRSNNSMRVLSIISTVFLPITCVCPAILGRRAMRSLVCRACSMP